MAVAEVVAVPNVPPEFSDAVILLALQKLAERDRACGGALLRYARIDVSPAGGAPAAAGRMQPNEER